MLPPLPLYSSLEAVLGISAAGALFLRYLHRDLWRRRAVQAASLAVFGVLLLAHGAWSVGRWHFPTSYWGAAIASAGLVLSGMLVVSLPPAALVRAGVTRAIHRVAPLPATLPVAPRVISRRAVIHAATAIVPVAALSLGVRGFASAACDAAVPRLPLVFPDLHPDLEGFTILQLSDLHLGMSKNVGDLERLLTRLDTAKDRPHLIVLTGDVAEDLRELAPALALVDAFHARHGALACLGNHEYLRDIRLSRPIYDKSQVPLLVNRGTELRVGAARLYVGGANDPVVVRTDIHPQMRANVEAAMHDAHATDFRLLLSHRPEGFDHAARAKVDLTLSGHTHGGQIGFNGKSAFEPLWPDGYLWGGYRRGASRLYTTSGFGDWFPFRLGCPSEAPLLVLTRSAQRSAERSARRLRE